MNIGFDAKRAFMNGSGLGNYSRQLLQGLFDFFPGEDYRLFTPVLKQEFAAQLQGNYKIILPEGVYDKAFPALWRSLKLAKALRKNRISLFHGLSNELPFGISNTGIPAVVTVHDIIFEYFPEYYPFADRQIYRYKTRYACRHAQKIIAVSQETRQNLTERYGIPDAKISVVPPVIEDRFYSIASAAQKKAVRQRYRLPENYLLYVGGFSARKNQKKLIESMALLKGQSDLPLVLAGNSGKLREELEAYGQRFQGANNLFFLSDVRNDDLPALYQGAAVFIYPSRKEGFGIPVVEALAGGVPVVTSKEGAMAEAGGQAAFSADVQSAESLAEQIMRALQKGQDRTEAGKAHADQFRARPLTEKLMTIYLELA